MEKQENRRPQKRDGSANRFRAFIASISQKHIANVGRFLGVLAYILDTRHRRIVKRNLQFTHPQWSQGNIQKLCKRVFQNAGITFVEICQVTCLSREDLLRNVRIKGEEHLLNAMKSPKGTILISGHLGNWEMAPLLISCYINKPLVLVVREMQSKALGRWIHRLRGRFGNIVIDKKGALPIMTQALRQGKMVGLLIDQGTKLSRGIEVSFFSHTTTSTLAPALLARRCGSPVLPVFCIREAGAGLTLVIGAPLSLKRTDDFRADLKANTQIMTSAIERAVRAYPEQWLWFHKRWKRHHPYLYSEDLARRQRRKAKRRA
ncbi:MAG: lysophospholipid acyltransferase family protein [Deltaproteobacteria bacterium]|nr:lysophospholipid acyltransferase family protein [Deltaproteobacteria bacterium]